MRYEEFRTGYIRLLAELDREIAEYEHLSDQPFLDDKERGTLTLSPNSATPVAGTD
jgi:hypothetical protein